LTTNWQPDKRLSCLSSRLRAGGKTRLQAALHIMWKGFQHYSDQLSAQIHTYLMNIATDGTSLNNCQETEASSFEEN
jgi:hypothetical protein